MSKVLIVGACPLPTDNSNTLYGLGQRTWHFTEPLLKEGHEVLLIAVRIPSAKEAGLGIPFVTKTQTDKFTFYSCNDPGSFHDIQFHQDLHDSFKPDCIIGINTYPASQAAKIKSSKPFWADLNGALMTEAQAKSFVNQNDESVSRFWEEELICLHRADIFSTVSIPQKYMLLGELATIGRLNQYTVDYDFAHHIPNSIENKIISKQKENLLRGTKVNPDDFVLLWSGGYNTWTDINTLFKGITSAMDNNPKIKYVSTGGALPGHDEKTYESFQKMIMNSPHKDKFHLLGWVPNEDVFEYYFESDLGINIDTWNYETLTGARNRLIHMMKIGLPVITSIGTEISHVIEDNKLGLTFPIGNPKALTDKIIYAAQHREELKQLGQKGQKFVYDNYSAERNTRAVQAWVNNPTPSPDRNRIVPTIEKQPPPPLKHGKPVEDMVNYFRTIFRKK